MPPWSTEAILEAIALPGPYLLFFAGVWLADVLSLYPDLNRKRLFGMSIPVGFITVSILLANVHVSYETLQCVDGRQLQYNNTQLLCTPRSVIIDAYAHIGSPVEFLLFSGIVMLTGTTVPELFEQARARLLKKKRRSR